MIGRTAIDHAVIAAFHDAAGEVPAYARILSEHGVDPAAVRDLDDFRRQVPIVDKAATFGRFPVAALCRGGELGRPAGVLTSSGHSGQFAYGLYDAAAAADEARRVDDALDRLLGVRRRATLLINAMPMGVKVPTRACTLAETSVREDMVTALVAQLGRHYEQLILVADAAFLKLVLEHGRQRGIDWRALRVHTIVGEEPLAENARKYLEGLLGCDPAHPDRGVVGSSMGVAERGLNLLYEVPPLVALRRALHDSVPLRRRLLGPEATCAPLLFTYDPSRAFVEVVADGRLVVSLLPRRLLPLIRYHTGDVAAAVGPDMLAAAADAAGLPAAWFDGLPVVMVHGRGECARAGEQDVTAEQVKEGVYLDALLAAQTTANFRLASGEREASVRIQLSPGVAAGPALDEAFREAISHYVRAPVSVRCERYERFGDGMTLDYERKFDYLGRG
jgi:phenylacetate-CoA ligase